MTKLVWTKDITVELPFEMEVDFDWEAFYVTREQTTTCMGAFVIFATDYGYAGYCNEYFVSRFASIDFAKDWIQRRDTRHLEKSNVPLTLHAFISG